MRVSCESFNDFMANLEAVNKADVYGKVIYFSLNRHPVDDPSRLKATRFDVVVQASCVINVDFGDSQYLLQFGEHVGFDRVAAGGNIEGSEAAKKIKDRLVLFCGERGIKVMPGMVSE